MSEIRALLFDTFGTLVDWRTGLITQLEQWGKARDIDADWPALVLAWRLAHAPALTKVRTGQREWATLDQLQAETLRELAPQYGLPALSDDNFLNLARMWHELPPWPDVVEGMVRLRTKYVVAPLSNGHVALLVHMVRTARITFDAVFGADVFRQYKPDPKTYLGASGCLDSNRVRCCLLRRTPRILRRPQDVDCAPAMSLARWNTATVSWWSGRRPRQSSTLWSAIFWNWRQFWRAKRYNTSDY
jgi:2-haloacid dehalogenase